MRKDTITFTDLADQWYGVRPVHNFREGLMEYLNGEITLVDGEGDTCTVAVSSIVYRMESLAAVITVECHVHSPWLVESGCQTPRFFYTFENDGPSVEFHVAAFEDFVRSHYRTAATQPTILPERPSRR